MTDSVPTTGAVAIDASFAGTVSYAMHQNSVPVVHHLRVSNGAGEPLSDLVVRIASDPPFAVAWERTLARVDADQTYDLGSVDLLLEHSFLAALQERVVGTIRVEVARNGDLLASHAAGITVLSHDEWAGTAGVPEMLAAFVAPNDPAVEELLSDAAQLLAEATGDSSLSGYQSRDPKRVLEIASAIYAALHNRGVRYVSPPASFERTGQKVRLPHRVLEHGLGTCLDLATLVAACLEQSGLNALVVLTEGHAFPSVWLSDDCFADASVDDGLRLAKLVELGEICAFDATLATSEASAPLHQAAREAARLLSDPAQFVCAVDVARARKSRVLPIPSSGAAQGGRESSSPERPVLGVSLPGTPLPQREEAVPETPATRLSKWKRKLLDLTMRNRLLNVGATKRVLRVQCPDLAGLEDALAEGRSFVLAALTDDALRAGGRDPATRHARTGEDALLAMLAEEMEAGRLYVEATEAELNRRLVEAYREARNSIEESGANTLYLALGMLEYYETASSSQPRHAPLMLVPLQMDRPSVREAFSIRLLDEEPMVNATLLELLKHDHGLLVPGVEQLPTDDRGVDLPKVLSAFRRAVRDVERWRVLEHAVIGHFSFTKFLMWHDLEARTADLMRSDVVRHLIETPGQRFRPSDPVTFASPDRLDETLAPQDCLCPMDADSSQLAAIAAAMDGRSFVLHGPPGTGKSQTITNIIAGALARGKSVLFVSEKMAALNVVQRRLTQCGLEPFCLELHSSRTQKRQALEQLRESVAAIGGCTSDDWTARGNRIAMLRQELNGYVEALHRHREHGQSVFGAVSRLQALHDAALVQLDWSSPAETSSSEVSAARGAAEQLGHAAADCGGPAGHAWSGVTHSAWRSTLRQEAEAALGRLSDCCGSLERKVGGAATVLGVDLAEASEAELLASGEAAAALLDAPAVPWEVLSLTDWSSADAALADWSTNSTRALTLARQLSPAVRDEALDCDVERLARRLARSDRRPWCSEAAAERASVCGELLREQPQRTVESPGTGGEAAYGELVGGEELDVAASRARESWAALLEAASPLAVALGIGAGAGDDARQAAVGRVVLAIQAAPTVPAGMLAPSVWAAADATMSEWAERGRRAQQMRAVLLEQFTEDVFRLGDDGLLSRLPASAGPWPGLGGWRARSAALRALSRRRRATTRLGKGEIERVVSSIRATLEDEQRLREAAPRAEALLGPLWAEGATDWDAVDRARNEAQALRAVLAEVVGDSRVGQAELRGRVMALLTERAGCTAVWDRVAALMAEYLRRRDDCARAARDLEHVGREAGLCGEFGASPADEVGCVIRGIDAWISRRGSTVARLLQDIDSLQSARAAVARAEREHRLLIGSLSIDGGPDADLARAARESSARLREAAQRIAPASAGCGLRGLPDRWASFAGRASDGGPPSGCLRSFASAVQSYRDARTHLEGLLSVDSALAWGDVSAPSHLARVVARVTGWQRCLSQLRDWCHWNEAREEAVGRGLRALVAAVEQGVLAPDGASRAFERSYLTWWVQRTTDADPVLSSFRSRDFERRISRFAEADSDYTRLAREEIRARLAAAAPACPRSPHQDSEMGILARELQKQRGHRPIRQLCRQIPNLLRSLKPCLLMSPLSVAQYLDPAAPPFDLVVFDEASQIPPWDAVGAMARGREVIVVGDPKQLPPTSFFTRSNEEEADADDVVDDVESVLEECIGARLPSLHLRWHYRSRHESLIAFSNQRYYAGSLLTFPAPNRELGVHLHRVAGVYDRSGSRTNRVEADAIVADVVRRLRDPALSRHSVGVVTFSSAQQTLIEDLLDDARRADPRLDQFFSEDTAPDGEAVLVKNLENVQGDERDVILLSICYGPDARGTVSMNFGPLNRAGGERRLNVAITRARRELHVYASMDADSIDLSRTRARAAADLRSFLDFAARGQLALVAALTANPDADAESPLEQAVCDALRARGHEVHHQVGCAGYRVDLGIVDRDRPGRYLLGVECDGATYHSFRTARDRDRLRASVLESLGWRLHRVWSTDWWQDPDLEVTRIERAIREAREADALSSASASPDGRTEPSPSGQPDAPGREPVARSDDAGEQATHAGLDRYSPYRSTQSLGDLRDFHDPSSSDAIVRVIADVVRHEGPVAVKAAERRVAEQWGIGRVGAKVAQRIAELIRRARVKRVRAGGREFLWPGDVDHDTYGGFRVSSSPDRPAEELAPQEVANAALYVLETQFGMPRDALVQETARMFGFQQVGSRVRESMEEGIKLLIKRGAGREGPDGVISSLPEAGR